MELVRFRGAMSCGKANWKMDELQQRTLGSAPGERPGTHPTLANFTAALGRTGDVKVMQGEGGQVHLLLLPQLPLPLFLFISLVAGLHRSAQACQSPPSQSGSLDDARWGVTTCMSHAAEGRCRGAPGGTLQA